MAVPLAYRRNERPHALLGVLAHIAVGLHAVGLKAYLTLFKRPADGFGSGLIGRTCRLGGWLPDLSDS